jgi:lambda family phage portal protein
MAKPAPLTIRQRVANWLAPAAPAAPRQANAARLYGGARMTNTTLGFGSGGSTSADAELATSLDRMRARSRQMLRDSAYAKRAQMVVVNNVIGAGVGLQAQVSTTRGALNAPLNAAIETAWSDWCAADACHTGGAMHFADLERMALGEVFATGEAIIRKHYRPFGASAVPLALEVIESERLAGDLVDPGAMVGKTAGANHEMRMGVECDEFQRPVAYWIRRGHPGDTRAYAADGARYERVPAADIFHLRLVTRWPQTRGEPWMHAVLRKLDDLNEYTQCEVTAARASAAYFGTVSLSPDMEPEEKADNGQPMLNIEPLTVQQLNQGETFEFHTPNRPNSALDPFMRAMLREVAAGCGPSYESLSRDYSQSNYSSSRLSLLDDRDLWRVLQQWWLRSFRKPLHATWLQQAALAAAVPGLAVAAYANDAAKFGAVSFKPRGWQWVDPTKEVTAYKEAIKAGLTTLTDVIAQTAGGLDIEDVIATRRRELDLLDEADIEVDTTVPEPLEPMTPAQAGAAMGGSPGGSPNAGDAEDAEDTETDDTTETATPRARVVALKRG